MLDKLKPALLTLLHSILGLKMTSSGSWVPAVLPPCAEPIITYSQRMAAMAMKNGDGITLLKKWQVKQARAFKSRSTSQHEYISATVVDSENKTSYVIIERVRGDPEPIHSSDTDQVIDPQPVKLFSASNPSISSISSVPDSISTCAVDDRITPISSPGKRNKSDELIYELIFEKPLYLYELAILAVIVHEENTSYLIMTNNCYHYAGTIMKVLENHYGIANTAVGAGAGKFCGLVLYPGKKEGNRSSLVEKFREGIKNFVSFLLVHE